MKTKHEPCDKHVAKYLYGWKLYVDYGQGWKFETFEDTITGYRKNKKAYRENCLYPQKWVKGRALNDQNTRKIMEFHKAM
jgi:hypothetical protein